MEVTDPLGRKTKQPISRWTSLLGTTIAMITLTVPVMAIAYYSSSNQTQVPLKTMILGDNSGGMILGKP